MFGFINRLVGNGFKKGEIAALRDEHAALKSRVQLFQVDLAQLEDELRQRKANDVTATVGIPNVVALSKSAAPLPKSAAGKKPNVTVRQFLIAQGLGDDPAVVRGVARRASFIAKKMKVKAGRSKEFYADRVRGNSKTYPNYIMLAALDIHTKTKTTAKG